MRNYLKLTLPFYQANILQCGSVPVNSLLLTTHSVTALTDIDHTLNLHASMQKLSPAEEETLVKWITRLNRSGYPITPALTLKIANEIQNMRVTLSTTPPFQPTPISDRWLSRFYLRHPEIEGVYARQLENARYKAINLEGVERWFAAVQELFFEHNYAPEDIYNMDESGFSVGASQTTRTLINIREKSSWKRIQGRQEWITAIECVRASGEALPPLVIFKAKHLNDKWVPRSIPSNWRWSTSNKGWTSNSHGYEWLITVFDPETRRKDPLFRPGFSTSINNGRTSKPRYSQRDCLLYK